MISYNAKKKRKLGLVARILDFVGCDKGTDKLCASAQSDHRLCYCSLESLMALIALYMP